MSWPKAVDVLEPEAPVTRETLPVTVTESPRLKRVDLAAYRELAAT